jgi:hypothetical protein
VTSINLQPKSNSTKVSVGLYMPIQIVTLFWLTIVIYATSFCVNWAFLIARGTRLKHKRSEDFKASGAIRKAQFTRKRDAYKILLFETTSLKLPNLLKTVSHLLLTVLTNFSRPVRNVTLNVLSRATVRYLLILL